MTMTLLETIRARHSVRHYLPDPVAEADLREILEAGILAPSAGNRQPWMFYVVADPVTRQALAASSGGQRCMTEAPLHIVVCVEPARSAERYKERGETLYCLQDTAAAIQNMLLAATALGYGTCWVGAFNEAAAAVALNLPETLRPIGIIAVGRAAETPVPRPRRPLEEIVRRVD
jgi:nitroreductase